LRRFDYYLRETAIGLRRNGIVAFAAMSTAFIALFLFGLALMIGREFGLVIDAVTGNVEVAVYLTDDASTDAVARLQTSLEDLPAVGSVTYESKDEAYQRFLRLFANQPAFTENTDPASIPASLRVRLADPSQFDQINAVTGCSVDPATGKQTCTQPGVESIHDFTDLLNKLTTITNILRLGILAIAVVMLASAVALIANTLRMGMFARRKEIGIMRLVGATNWRIRVPFLIEGLVESLLGASAAVLGLFLVKVTVFDRLRTQIQWAPIIRNSDVIAIAPLILIAGAVIAIIAGTVGMRRFLDV
jgi:cell division transport system permease protein